MKRTFWFCAYQFFIFCITNFIFCNIILLPINNIRYYWFLDSSLQTLCDDLIKCGNSYSKDCNILKLKNIIMINANSSKIFECDKISSVDTLPLRNIKRFLVQQNIYGSDIAIPIFNNKISIQLELSNVSQINYIYMQVSYPTPIKIVIEKYNDPLKIWSQLYNVNSCIFTYNTSECPKNDENINLSEKPVKAIRITFHWSNKTTLTYFYIYNITLYGRFYQTPNTLYPFSINKTENSKFPIINNETFASKMSAISNNNVFVNYSRILNISHVLSDLSDNALTMNETVPLFRKPQNNAPESSLKFANGVFNTSPLSANKENSNTIYFNDTTTLNLNTFSNDPILNLTRYTVVKPEKQPNKSWNKSYYMMPNDFSYGSSSYNFLSHFFHDIIPKTPINYTNNNSMFMDKAIFNSSQNLLFTTTTPTINFIYSSANVVTNTINDAMNQNMSKIPYFDPFYNLINNTTPGNNITSIFISAFMNNTNTTNMISDTNITPFNYAFDSNHQDFTLPEPELYTSTLLAHTVSNIPILNISSYANLSEGNTQNSNISFTTILPYWLVENYHLTPPLVKNFSNASFVETNVSCINNISNSINLFMELSGKLLIPTWWYNQNLPALCQLLDATQTSVYAHPCLSHSIILEDNDTMINHLVRDCSQLFTQITPTNLQTYAYYSSLNVTSLLIEDPLLKQKQRLKPKNGKKWWPLFENNYVNQLLWNSWLAGYFTKNLQMNHPAPPRSSFYDKSLNYDTLPFNLGGGGVNLNSQQTLPSTDSNLITPAEWENDLGINSPLTVMEKERQNRNINWLIAILGLLTLLGLASLLTYFVSRCKHRITEWFPNNNPQEPNDSNNPNDINNVIQYNRFKRLNMEREPNSSGNINVVNSPFKPAINYGFEDDDPVYYGNVEIMAGTSNQYPLQNDLDNLDRNYANDARTSNNYKVVRQLYAIPETHIV